VTGAPGLIGLALAPELIQSGHRMLGLARSVAGAKKLRGAGAEVLCGNIKDFEGLREGASKNDVSFIWPSTKTFRSFRRTLTTTKRWRSARCS
jgi:uncharacterized protein YbjT (DUF2867 family)